MRLDQFPQYPQLAELHDDENNTFFLPLPQTIAMHNCAMIA